MTRCILRLTLLGLIGGIGGTGGTGGCSAEPDEPGRPSVANGQAPDARGGAASSVDAWIELAHDEWKRIEDAHQHTSLGMQTVLSIAAAGDTDRAVALTEQMFEGDDRDTALRYIAGGESARGQLDVALALRDGIADEIIAHWATSLIAVRQAQRGQIRAAMGLLDEIPTPYLRDRVRRAVVDAHLRAGDPDAAEAVGQTITDETTRQQAFEAIAAPESVRHGAFELAESYPIIENLMAALAFSAPTEAMAAVQRAGRAIEDHDDAAIDDAVAEALTLTEDEAPLQRSTMRLLVGIVLVAADRIEQAEALFDGIITESGQDPLDLGNWLVQPAVAYMLVLLEREQQVQAMLASIRERATDEALTLPARADEVLVAVAMAHAESGAIDRAEAQYRALTDPAERVAFANGMVRGLSARQKREERSNGDGHGNGDGP